MAKSLVVKRTTRAQKREFELGCLRKACDEGICGIPRLAKRVSAIAKYPLSYNRVGYLMHLTRHHDGQISYRIPHIKRGRTGKQSLVFAVDESSPRLTAQQTLAFNMGVHGQVKELMSKAASLTKNLLTTESHLSLADRRIYESLMEDVKYN